MQIDKGKGNLPLVLWVTAFLVFIAICCCPMHCSTGSKQSAGSFPKDHQRIVPKKSVLPFGNPLSTVPRPPTALRKKWSLVY